MKSDRTLIEIDLHPAEGSKNVSPKRR